ncbi:MAG: hypothetical protein ACOC80_12865 [Petrotogales bacterium]
METEALKRLAVYGSPMSKAAALTLLCKEDAELEQELEKIIHSNGESKNDKNVGKSGFGSG